MNMQFSEKIWDTNINTLAITNRKKQTFYFVKKTE